MPWNAKNFRSRHNKHLTDSQAKKAAEMANAMLRSGTPEGIAIATANKRVKGKHWPPRKKTAYSY